MTKHPKPSAAPLRAVPDVTTIDPLIASWQRGLRAERKSPRTIENYVRTVRAFTTWAAANGIPIDPERQTGRDVQSFLVDLLDRGAADSSAALYFACLRAWFRWLALEEEIETS